MQKTLIETLTWSQFLEEKSRTLDLLEKGLKEINWSGGFQYGDVKDEIRRSSNYGLDSATLLFPYASFGSSALPNEIAIRINKPGWVEWFLQNRARNMFPFNYSLSKNNANTPDGFKKFFKEYICLTPSEYSCVKKIDSLQSITSKFETKRLEIVNSKLDLFKSKYYEGKDLIGKPYYRLTTDFAFILETQFTFFFYYFSHFGYSLTESFGPSKTLEYSLFAPCSASFSKLLMRSTRLKFLTCFRAVWQWVFTLSHAQRGILIL